MKLSIFNSFCYTIGWFWCVLCGIRGHPILAFMGALFLIFIQLFYTKINHLNLYIQDLLLVLISVPLGFIMELFFIQMNFIRYVNSNGITPPIWIISLYPLFSLLLNHSLKIIKKNDLVSFLFGFFGAPMSYVSGRYLGGVIFTYPFLLTWVVIGAGWGLFLCLLTHIAQRIEKLHKNYH